MELLSAYHVAREGRVRLALDILAKTYHDISKELGGGGDDVEKAFLHFYRLELTSLLLEAAYIEERKTSVEKFVGAASALGLKLMALGCIPREGSRAPTCWFFASCDMRSQVAVGVFEMLSVTAIWGSVPVIFKLSGLPSPVFVFFRVAITAVLLAVALRRFTYSGLTAVLSGVFLALNWIFLFYATALMPVSTAVMIYYAGPIMASVYMHFLGEKMQKPKFLALLISFTGVALLVGFASYVTPLGLLFAVLSAAFYVSTYSYQQALCNPYGAYLLGPMPDVRGNVFHSAFPSYMQV